MAVRNPRVVAPRTTVTKDTWTALPDQRGGLLKIFAKSTTQSATFTISVLVSPSGTAGTIGEQANRADTLAAAAAVALTCSAVKVDATYYATSLVVMIPPDCDAIKILEAAGASGTMIYSIQGL